MGAEFDSLGSVEIAFLHPPQKASPWMLETHELCFGHLRMEFSSLRKPTQSINMIFVYHTCFQIKTGTHPHRDTDSFRNWTMMWNYSMLSLRFGNVLALHPESIHLKPQKTHLNKTMAIMLTPNTQCRVYAPIYIYHKIN